MKNQLYYNGDILTMNDAQPTAEAMLVGDGKIIAVGSYEEVEKKAAVGTELVDLGGKTLLPGFIDGHSHFSFSQMVTKFDAPPVGDIDSVEKLVEAAKAVLEKNPVKKGSAFMGMGYDNAAFPDQRHPTRHDLDKISTDVPILMLHVSGHVGAVNTKALEVLGIDENTPDPDGGIIRREEGSDVPNGVLEEVAVQGIAMKQLKIAPSFDTILKRVDAAQELYMSNGYTTVQDGGFNAATNALMAIYRAMGKLKIDLCAYVMFDGGKNLLKKSNSTKPVYKKHFRIGGAKFILDGSPQAKTAWLTKPYHVIPEGKDADYCGYPTYADSSKLREQFEYCIKNNIQLLAHCNGDAASDQFIEQYSAAAKNVGSKTDLRPVMVHCQTVRDDQLDKMKEIGMFPTVFIGHTYFWGDYHVSSVLGPERGNRISPLASMIERGMEFSLHQDTPITPPNMLHSIHQAVNRTSFRGQTIGDAQKISINDALKAATIWAAKQYFEEDTKGSLEAGKLADLVILDRNPLKVASEDIKNICVCATIKEGKTVWSK